MYFSMCRECYKVKKDFLWKKEHTKSRKSETRFDRVTVVCEAAYAPLAPALAVFDFQNNQDGLKNPKGSQI